MVLVAGVFLILHGLVHLLYVGHSAGLFELRPGMAWPDGSWVFARLASVTSARLLAGAACSTAAVGFVVGGAALIAGQAWWREVVVGSALFASASWVLFWDATPADLSGQGGVALLINAALLVGLLAVPRLDLLLP